jgi:hypothetical protein
VALAVMRPDKKNKNSKKVPIPYLLSSLFL